MPVILDREATGVQDPKRKRDQFLNIPLTDAQKETVVYRKAPSLNPELADTQRDTGSVWEEEFTDVPQVLKQINAKSRVFLEDEFGDRQGISEDDGYIFYYHGTFAGERGRLLNGRIVSTEEVEENEDLTDDEVEMVALWEFRLAKLIKTDGPERRERLQDSVEEQRARSESGLVDTIKAAFSAIAMQSGGQTPELNTNTMATDPQSMLKALASMSEDQREAMFAQAQMEADDQERMAIEVAPDPPKAAKKTAKSKTEA